MNRDVVPMDKSMGCRVTNTIIKPMASAMGRGGEDDLKTKNYWRMY